MAEATVQIEAGAQENAQLTQSYAALVIAIAVYLVVTFPALASP